MGIQGGKHPPEWQQFIWMMVFVTTVGIICMTSIGFFHYKWQQEQQHGSR